MVVGTVAVATTIGWLTGCTDEQSLSPPPTVPGGSVTGPAPLPESTQDPWSTFRESAAGCTTNQPFAVPLSGAVPRRLATAINDCAVLLSEPESMSIVFRDGIARFPQPPAQVSIAEVVASPAGYWLAGDNLATESPILQYVEEDRRVTVDLSTDLLSIDSMTESDGRLLFGASLAEPEISWSAGDAELFSVTATTAPASIRTFSAGTISAISTNDAAIAVGIEGSGASALAYTYGTDWKQVELPGTVTGVAVKGDLLVALSNRLENGAPVAAVLTFSRDRGATWETTEVIGGDSEALPGFHGNSVVATMSIPGSDARVFTAPLGSDWEALDIPDLQAWDSLETALAPCGVWAMSDQFVSYTPLPGTCP